MIHRPALAMLCLALLTILPAPAAALDLKQRYEEQLERWALSQSKLEREPAPAGKIIERIVIVREDIIADSDPWPNFLNHLHAKTREYVVRQELLIAPGERWDEARIEESARNLRKLPILAVVRTVACRSRQPGQVILLVVTKDLWSIRLNTSFSMVGTTVQMLSFYPTEMNFLGRNKRLSLHLRLQQLDLERFAVRDQLALGQVYIDNRVLGSRWAFMEQFDALIAGDVPCGGALGADHRQWCPDFSSGKMEGAYGLLWLQRPLYALDTRWGFDLYGVVDIARVRRFVSAGTGESSGPALRTALYVDPSGRRQLVPRLYDRRAMAAAASFTRSFGRAIKKDLTAGLKVYQNRYAPPDNLELEEDVRSWYQASYLPRSEEATYAFLTFNTYTPRFVKLHNIQTFALTEDYRLGHDLTLGSNFALNLGDAAQSFITMSFTAAYRWLVRNDLLWVGCSGTTRWQPELYALGHSTPWANSELSLSAKNVSPPFWRGRVHAQVRALLRGNQLDRVTSLLGGDSGLRGYPSEHFEGKNLFGVNLEYRSEPINLLTLHLGFVLFYDGGALFGGPDPRQPLQELAFVYHQSLGLGLRGRFPQFDRETLRVDFGVPLDGDRGALGTWFSFSFGQVF